MTGTGITRIKNFKDLFSAGRRSPENFYPSRPDKKNTLTLFPFKKKNLSLLEGFFFKEGFNVVKFIRGKILKQSDLFKIYIIRLGFFMHKSSLIEPYTKKLFEGIGYFPPLYHSSAPPV